jgi:predicted ArsR family transcriptional regulator
MIRQDQARALGDPTRHALFAAVIEADEPVPVVDLARVVGLDANAVRPQLGRLVAAGLLEELVDPVRRRGRPRHLYRPGPVASEVASAGGGPYRLLTELILQARVDGRGLDEVGRARGRELGRDATGHADPVGVLEQELARQGFAPQRTPVDAEGATLVLHHCPYAAALAVDAEAVCALHRGLCRGFAEAVGLCQVDLVPADPTGAGCRVELRPEGDPRTAVAE